MVFGVDYILCLNILCIARKKEKGALQSFPFWGIIPRNFRSIFLSTKHCDLLGFSIQYVTEKSGCLASRLPFLFKNVINGNKYLWQLYEQQTLHLSIQRTKRI